MHSNILAPIPTAKLFWSRSHTWQIVLVTLNAVQGIYVQNSVLASAAVKGDLIRRSGKEWTLCRHLCQVIKNGKSRICRLHFVNTTFSVVSSYPAQWQNTARWTTCSSHTLLLLATHLLPQGWRPAMSWSQQNKKIQEEDRVSANTDAATHF